jgi:dTDP-4-amino-4,6-dideoxygalactose transaminase
MCPSDSRIIGGMFGLPEPVTKNARGGVPEKLSGGGSKLFLANARSGLLILTEILNPQRVWMPSYLCPVMLEIVDREKTSVRFYDVDQNLNVASEEWMQDIGSGDIIVLIDYFGFPISREVAQKAKSRGAWILEDACQSLLSAHVGAHSDFVLFSPRKYVGMPDGGILASCCDIALDEIELRPCPKDWWLQTLEAAIGRREFDQWGGERGWFELNQETESSVPCGRYAMSDLSRTLFSSSFDYSGIAARRRENYSILADELRQLAVRPILPLDVVPLGFPIVHPQRDLLRKALFKQGIYPPVHWAIGDAVPDSFVDAHCLADRTMTLPCDQRYAEADMRRMGKAILVASDVIQGGMPA